MPPYRRGPSYPFTGPARRSDVQAGGPVRTRASGACSPRRQVCQSGPPGIPSAPSRDHPARPTHWDASGSLSSPVGGAPAICLAGTSRSRRWGSMPLSRAVAREKEGRRPGRLPEPPRGAYARWVNCAARWSVSRRMCSGTPAWRRRCARLDWMPEPSQTMASIGRSLTRFSLRRKGPR